MTDQWKQDHPGRDPELLERYALSQLPMSQRTALDAHFRDCAECRRALEEELRLAAGVRKMARAQLKNRLASRLSQAPSFAVPWPRVFAIAAVILIVAGVSVIGIWIQHREQVVAPPPGSGASGPSLAADRDRGRQEAPAIPPSAKGEGAHEQVSSRRGELSYRGGKDLTANEEAGGAVIREKKSQAPIEKKKAASEIQAAPSAAVASGAGSSEGFWTEGVVSEEQVAAVETERHDEMQKAVANKLEMPANAARTAAAKSLAAEQQVILTQQPSRLLQAQQQGRLQQSGRKGIPTLVRQEGDQLRLTLYPDTLFSPADLQHATVLRRGDDSLVIQVGTQLIRYRFPSSLLQQRITR
jgi:hypothetical protein